MNLSHKVYHALLDQHLLPDGSPLVVAVSGGADSLALLHILHTLAPQLNLELHVATLNHGLRGKAGAVDAAFVQQTALDWNIPCTVGQADVLGMMQVQGLGLETAARRARYDFLVDVARHVNATHIAVAHHADDQAETVFMHLLRGSGVTGLTGMAWRAPVPGHPNFTLIRPLRDISRAEIEAYCHEQGLQPRVDASNSDTHLLRNAIRLNIIPHLRQVNPQVQRALNQLADIVATEQDFIEHQYSNEVKPHIVQAKGRLTLPREIFIQLHPALQRRFIYHAAQILGQDKDRYSGYRHILAAIDVAVQGQVGVLVQLPGGLHVRVDYDHIVVEHTDTPRPADNQLLMMPDSEIAINVPGIVSIPDSDWSLVAAQLPLSVTYARIALPTDCAIVLRARRTGDRFAPQGMDGKHQTVKKWMINRKIPRHIRDSIPLLVINGEVAVVMIGGVWAIAETFMAHRASPHVVYLGTSVASL